MKTYEEMARDVLKRRDEELRKMQHPAHDLQPEVVYPAVSKKRGLVPKIVIPCTAAVTAAAVGVGIWHNNAPGERYINNGLVNAEDSYYFNPLIGEGDKFNESEYIAASYKGGKTEINFNSRTDVYHELWALNSPFPELLNDDFIDIPDNEINSFYMIEFDRLTSCYPDWQSEHDPFGYYNRDEESDGVVSHAVHGYFSTNMIRYSNGNGGKVNVTASWMKYSLNDSDDKASLLNGFGAYVYKDGQGNYRAEIDMGAHVTIYAENLTEEQFTEILKAYTLPPEQSTENTFCLYITRPDCLEKHIFYNGRCLTDDVSQVLLTKDELNAVYDMEFDRFGRLHPDWNENVSVYPRVFVSDYENTEASVDTIGGRKIVAALNRIDYYMNYMTADENLPWLSVKADLIGVAEDSFSPFDGSHGNTEKISVINGKKALIWSNGGDCAFSAVIEMGKTLVEISSCYFSEDEFISFLEEYTAESPKSDAKEKDVVKILDALPKEIILPNAADRPQSDDYTFVAHNKAQLSDFYGMEFDCLGKLHKDWEEVTENDLGILVYGDEKVTADVAYPSADRENVWSQNTIKYRISDKSSVTVTAMLGDLNPPLDYYVFGYITGGETDNVSLINGRYALIWRGNESSSQLAAAMRMGRSTVIIQAEGLSDAEFTDVLKEYAASTTNDNVSRRIPCKYYNTADFVDDRINYAVKLTEKKILFSKKTDIEQTAQTEGSAAALGYFKEFFGNDDLPVDAAYNDNWVRYVYDAKFECAVEPNTTVCSPVNGKVIAASDCNGDLGKTVAVEFVNRVFILSNLDEVNVKPGDEITAGQVLGICGAADDQAPRLTMTLMTITDDRA